MIIFIIWTCRMNGGVNLSSGILIFSVSHNIMFVEEAINLQGSVSVKTSLHELGVPGWQVPCCAGTVLFSCRSQVCVFVSFFKKTNHTLSRKNSVVYTLYIVACFLCDC